MRGPSLAAQYCLIRSLHGRNSIMNFFSFGSKSELTGTLRHGLCKQRLTTMQKVCKTVLTHKMQSSRHNLIIQGRGIASPCTRDSHALRSRDDDQAPSLFSLATKAQSSFSVCAA